MNKRIVISTFLLSLACCLELVAQKIEIGAGVGAMNYKGDMSPSLNPSLAKLGGNIMFRYNLKRDLSFRASATMGSIYGDDKKVSDPFNQQRGLSFTSQITELALLAEYNFFTYQYNRYHKDWSPYVFGGVGFMKFTPNTPVVYEYRQNQVVLPFGVGIKYNLHGPWDLNLEFGTRKTFTDYLDNLGGDHPLVAKNLQNDYSTGDLYYYTSLTVTYKFFKIFCPD
ncbi:MAG: DUF6089 family protein [Spirosomataceae bacterium]